MLTAGGEISYVDGLAINSTCMNLTALFCLEMESDSSLNSCLKHILNNIWTDYIYMIFEQAITSVYK